MNVETYPEFLATFPAAIDIPLRKGAWPQDRAAKIGHADAFERYEPFLETLGQGEV